MNISNLVIPVLCILQLVATTPAWGIDVCEAPAKSIAPQINDLCFLQFETDDIAHAGVQACIAALDPLPDTCVNRTHLKAYRCQLLRQKKLLEKKVTDDECLKATVSEGYFVQGCEYPFDKRCKHCGCYVGCWNGCECRK